MPIRTRFLMAASFFLTLAVLGWATRGWLWGVGPVLIGGIVAAGLLFFTRPRAVKP